MSARFKVGDICLFNKDNKIPMSGNRILYTKIMSKKLSIKGWLYMCCICDAEGIIVNENPMPVRKQYLTKLHPGEVVVVRYPEDIPIITVQDVSLIKGLNSIIGSKLDQGTQTQLAKLIVKLELFVKIINEY